MLNIREKDRLLEFVDGQLIDWENMSAKDLQSMPNPLAKKETIAQIQKFHRVILDERYSLLDNVEVEALIDMVEFRMRRLAFTGFGIECGIMSNVRAKLKWVMLQRTNNN